MTDNERLQHIQGARILLAEDNEINQQVATEILEGAGLVVTIANNGKEAVDMAKQSSFDAILMDIQMPEMEGYEATRILRSDAQFKDMPIIAMTAHAMAGDREKCLDSGMNDYVTKPIDPDQLFSTLTRWIKPGERDRPVPPVRRVEGAPVPLPELPGLDIADGLRRVGGNTHVYRKVLKGFLSDYRDSGASIRADLEAGRFDTAQRSAHTIKGVAGNIGAQALFSTAGAFELVLKEGRTEEAPKSFPDFEASLDQVLSGLTAWSRIEAKATVEQTTSDSRAPDFRAAGQVVPQMIRLLEDGDAEAADLLPQLRTALTGAGVEVALDDLEAHIDAFDFDEALAALDPIAQIVNVNLMKDAS